MVGFTKWQFSFYEMEVKGDKGLSKPRLPRMRHFKIINFCFCICASLNFFLKFPYSYMLYLKGRDYLKFLI